MRGFMKSGTVFDIKEFSIYDGNGMRVTVFLKGCPLSCKWCHNPEGLSALPEVMVNVSACVNCGSCQVVGCAKTEKGKCSACGKCIDKCPYGYRQIKGEIYSSKDLADRLNSYEVFFGDDGGVTFSGGEPTLQYDFLMEVVDSIKGKTAIETCGYCDEVKFKKLIDKLSFVYIDFKVFDDEKHKFYTGVSNAVIKKNLQYLASSNKPFIVRIPMIKGVNDDIENLTATANLIKGAKNLVRVEILPYNALAPAKYGMVGKNYEYNFTKPDKIDCKPFTDLGISVKIL